MIVTIDGPAGAGKSSVARALARRLGFDFLDTGAMYRTVALAALERQLDWQQTARLVELAQGLEIRLDGEHVWLGDDDVSQRIRRPQVGNVIHWVADNPEIRAHLVRLQREAAQGRDIVAEGRDLGTVVFPAAECKIFLTASDVERARRRCRQLAQQGPPPDFEQVLAEQRDRDQRDRTRSVGALQAAPDAVRVETDGLSQEEVIDRLAALVGERSGSTPPRRPSDAGASASPTPARRPGP